MKQFIIGLVTLGPKGGATPGGSKVAEIGPVPPVTAPEYLLRINVRASLPADVMLEQGAAGAESGQPTGIRGEYHGQPLIAV